MHKTSRRTKHAKICLSLISLGAVASVLAAPAAQAQAAEAQYQFNIPAQSLEGALLQFTKVTGLQLVYPASITQGLNSAGASGEWSASAALVRLLANTGLTFRRTSSGSITIEKAIEAGPDGERVLGAVRVEGAQGYGLPGATSVNGINGSRDVTATEGTGSYTTGAMTVGGKVVASIKETPQSVSVLTNQQIKDRNVNSLEDAMRQLPGVTVVTGGTSGGLNVGADYISRGFPIDRFQIDGGAPIQGGNQTDQIGNSYMPIMDMSIYDHVELLRGAAAFSGYGSPGGTINLVRKRALDHFQTKIDLQYGSWNNYRGSIDVTGPLGFNGALRGRVVATYQDNDYFYKVAHDSRMVLFATIDIDVTKSTTINAGINYTKQNSVPFYNGLPRYQNGDDIGLPRSTCICFTWNDFKLTSTEYFVGINQRLWGNWTLNVKYNKPKQAYSSKTGFNNSTIDSSTNLGRLNASQGVGITNSQYSAEASLGGSFYLFGKEQKIFASASISKSNVPNSDIYDSQFYPIESQRPVFNVTNFNPYSSAQFPMPPGSSSPFVRFLEWQFQNIGAFLDVDLTPIKGVHILTGVRYTKFYSRKAVAVLCTPLFIQYDICAASQLGQEFEPRQEPQVDRDKTFAWPPKVTIRYDVNPKLSIYGAYTDIYQTQKVNDPTGKRLRPVTGSNIEGGLKWQNESGKFNANASFYRTEQYNVALFGSDGGVICTNLGCGVNGSRDQYRNTSKGIDFEVSGEILPRLQISGSMNYAKNQFFSSVYKVIGRNSSSRSPSWMYKLQASYAVPQEYFLSGLQLNGGFSGQDSNYVAGTYCSRLSETDLDPVTRAPQCEETTDFDFTQPARVIFNIGGSYKLADRYELSFNIENLFDKKYYQTGGDVFGGNWYGTPRSIMLNLRGTW
jgi:outer-membrane receptor for ferric coprogen and ferric-rhodotorulic acid